MARRRDVPPALETMSNGSPTSRNSTLGIMRAFINRRQAGRKLAARLLELPQPAAT